MDGVVLPPVVGRGDELRRLEQALDRLRAGHGGLLGLIGDPGIGKTRLINELADRAETAGIRVIRGWGREPARGVALVLFAEMLHVYRRDAAGETEAARQQAAMLEPDRHLIAPDDQLRYQFYRRLRDFLVDRARPSGVLLTLDDLHWADDASAEVLAYLLSGHMSSPILIALAYRPNQIGPRIAAAVQKVVAHGQMELITLGPLDRQAAAELVGGAVSRSRFEELYTLSAGNPFYLQALCDAEAGTTGGEADGNRQPGSAPADAAKVPFRRSAGSVPPGLASALLAELDALSQNARLTALAAAVAGEPIDTDLTASIAELPTTAVLEAVNELQQRDVIRRSQHDDGLWFRHPVLRQVVYHSAGVGWLVLAHERASQRLAHRHVPLGVRAFHVERAARPGDLSAVAILTDAGDHALRHAPATAAHWYQAALRLLPAGTRHQEARSSLRLGLGYALGLTGQLSQAHLVFRELLDETPYHRHPLRTQTVSMSASIERLRGRHNESAALLQAELATLGEDDVPEAIPLLLELACHHFLLQEHNDHRRHAERALELAERQHCREHTLSAAMLLSLAYCGLGEIPEASRYLDKAVALVDEMTDDMILEILESFIGLSIAETYLDRYDDAIRHLRRAIDLVQATGREFTLSTLLSTLAGAYLCAGRLDRAAAVARDALDAALVTGLDQQRMFALSVLSDISWCGGDQHAALALARQAAESATQFTDWPGVTVQGNAVLMIGALCRGGDPGLDDYVTRLGGPDLPRLHLIARPRAYAELSRAELQHGRPRPARLWAERGQRCSRALGLQSAEGHSALAWAEVRLASDPAAALVDARSATRSFSRAGAALFAALATLIAGKALRALGRHTEAADEFRAAEDAFARAAAPLLAGQARQLREGSAAEPESRQQATLSAGAPAGLLALSRRERQVAWLIADGSTNRQIARALGLSDKTVEVHVSHILKKLDVPTRAAVATIVVRSS